MESKTLHFLSLLAENNNRDWFQENRKLYDAAKADMEKLVGYLITEVGKFQDLGNLQVKECLLRINRDIRFSKNKAPYKNNLAAGIGPAVKALAKLIIIYKFNQGICRFWEEVCGTPHPNSWPGFARR
ncbi:DUF2461 domain-containing protein [Paucibacter sp. O1-1]|nr:DUF2461 domain-containing protein [Paucibacter sp. O1-1]MDA3831697.1 DUF2461 domain-containing protein [Paucibacter sp. O1-1]